MTTKPSVNFEKNYGPITISNQSTVARVSVVGQLIEIISQAEMVYTNLNRIPSEIDVKIKFNDLKRNKWIAELYKQDSLVIDESIKALDLIIPRGSEKLKRQMKSFYKQALGKYNIDNDVFNLDNLRLHSDNIIDYVLNATRELVDNCSNLSSGVLKEDFEYGVQLVTSYSIIECVVLENPNDHN
ncbi:Uncharacterised protein [Yersinia enterocolitica]|uniref:Uncharacterized protein n=1 Tax=Yersinia enterocolitica TaxID=630 RepID=A0A9P1M2X0_YEREN|nr:hypothetical protein [Yersinia enterocolitica]OVZ89050.1 hypothetical protein CBW54_08740 [Yersinia kristensenii]CNE88025.1 Uncharacterised protein [Yersinia enterocolitica]